MKEITEGEDTGMKREGKLICNCCGRELREKNGQLIEDFFHMNKTWGYFSGKDGICQSADICEECMEQWIREFQIQPETVDRTEIFEC